MIIFGDKWGRVYTQKTCDGRRGHNSPLLGGGGLLAKGFFQRICPAREGLAAPSRLLPGELITEEKKSTGQNYLDPVQCHPIPPSFL